MDSNAPCRTLYVRNLPEKLPKPKLRRLLHAAFTTHGHVVTLVAEKTLKLRGQAFVTFERLSSATAALRALHGTSFLGRTLSIGYARAVSDRAAGPARGGDDALPRKARAEKRRADAAEAARVAAQQAENERREQQPALIAEGVPAADEPPPQIVVPVPPNRILFVENLPKEVAAEEGGKPLQVAAALTDLFARFAGFVEVRTVPGKDGIAFVEFSSESESAVAMSGLGGHPIGVPPTPMKVSFAKK